VHLRRSYEVHRGTGNFRQWQSFPAVFVQWKGDDTKSRKVSDELIPDHCPISTDFAATCTFSQELASEQFSAKPRSSAKKWSVLYQPRSTVFLTNSKIYGSAVALSTAINTNEINAGRLYPELERIREVSVIVAREVIREAQRQRLDGEKSIRDLSDAELDAWIRVRMYDPTKENGRDDQTEAWRVRGSPQKSLL
jgi:hypothetical protein